MRIIFISILLVLSFASLSQNIEKDAYDVLKTEESAGIKVNPNSYLLLDSIFNMADSLVLMPSKDDSVFVSLALGEFSRILEEKFGFSYDLVQTFSIALANRVLDCNYYSLIFYTYFNKKKGQPVFPILVPGHMFIRWTFSDGNYLNYETTNTTSPNDEYYRGSFKINKQTEKSCLYLCPLVDSRMTAVHLAEIAYDIADTNIDKSISLCRKALALDTLSFIVYNNISNSYYYKDMQDSSDYFFEKARSLDSLNYTIYSKRGEMFMQKQKYEDALVWFSKAIAINPDDPMLFMLRCYAHIKAEDVENAMNDFELANKKIEKKTLLSFLVNYPLLSYLDNEIVLLYNEK